MLSPSSKDLYLKYQHLLPLSFFVLGFLFDAVTLSRIDDPVVIIQQAVYLILAMVIVGTELAELKKEITPPSWLAKAWKYRESALHFVLGSLLSSYTIFYFKSASAFTSLVFIALLALLLVVNEFKRFSNSRTKAHMAFLSLCILSYFVGLLPIALGFIGTIPFLGANLVSAAVLAAFYIVLSRTNNVDDLTAHRQILVPAGWVHGAFALLYFAHVIPPVPLSVTYMGIYHDVQKQDGKYALSYTRPNWKFWQHGDQTFLARPGDSVFCFMRVFSPSRFKDQLQVRWFFHDNKLGWTPSDAVPISIFGGRDEGYRAVTKKNNYQPGDWRVTVETRDGREVGSIDFTIETDTSTNERDVKTTIL